MKVSIIIPTFNCGKFIKKNLNKYININEMYNLLFVDSSSSDDTLSLLRKITDNIVIIPQSEFDHGGTRSEAALKTNADIIVYLTQDALPIDISAIEKIIKVFEDETIGAAFGRQIPYENTNLFGKHLRYFNYVDKSYIRCIDDKDKYGIKAAFLSNSFAAYRRSAMDEIGWFKDGLILGEDTYAGAKLLKAGYKIAYVADAVVYHSHSYTVWQEFKRYFDIGAFHQMEHWILDEFGKPEGEGIKYIKSEFRFILKNKKIYFIPEFLVRNIMKYLGYKLGNIYKYLPKGLIKRLSMNSKWWDKEKV
ncbi:O antigen biosynthesis rhamnosyltransferase rfbN [[Clostridium] ultunense Esp]|nr:O antigen biosynthesis rhamnosyltransferase rfbN [[Clostridium] ultunense Esp]